tara:strand:+ start:505 stop:1863 length:1359 start_codon:yes stop_codon:yes gene_type:complete
MNIVNDQIDFNFSRPLDIQKNLDLKKAESLLENSVSLKKKNYLLEKHLKLLLIELFYCWYESSEQFLSVSMSKRGYNSKSRYNPNNISSYTIPAVHFLKKNELIDLFPGFFDRKTKKSRLTRIKASRGLRNYFEDSLQFIDKKVNHPRREFVIIRDQLNNKVEYKDNFKTHEIREILAEYNNLLSTNIIDVPTYENKFFVRTDKRKIAISETASQANILFKHDSLNIEKFEGCWWNNLDISLTNIYQNKFLINNNPTSYVDLNDFFENYLLIQLNIKRLRTSEDFNFTQICKIISKGLKLENYQSLLKSLCIDKGNFFADKNICISEIKLKIDQFLKKNKEISSHFFKGKQINWESVVAKVFFMLLKKIVPAKIPVFLIQEKIYFPNKFQQNILKTLNEILEKELGLFKQVPRSYPCDSYNFKNKAFFSNILSRKIKCSNRYLNRISNQRLK